MPGYIIKALTKYQHAIPERPQHQPYKYTSIQYGANIRHIVEPDTSAPLTKGQIKHVQDIVCTLLYYGRAFDPTILTSLSAISFRQVKGTEAVLIAYHQLLDYVATYPNAVIRYHASEIILALDTDASYLSENDGKIRAAAYMFLTNKNNHISKMAPSLLSLK